MKQQPISYPPKFPVDDGLVLYMSFQEGTGRFTADLSGRDNHGTLNNVNWKTGRNGHAPDFVPASQSIVSVVADKSLDVSKVSIVVVAKSDIVGSAYVNAGHLVNKKNTNANTYGVVLNASVNKIRFTIRLNGSEGTIRSVDANTELDTARHIYIATYDGEEMLLDVDGIEQTDTLSISGSIDMDNSDILTIGRHPDVTTQAWDGLIEALLIYNRTLSKDEKRRIYEVLL